MNQRNVLAARLILLGLLGLLIYWVASNTYWDEIKIPSALRNEAATNPFYGAQRLVEKLGATSSWDRFQRQSSPEAVSVVSSWHWDLAEGRRSRMEQWVESGGRLVLDRTLVGGQEAFERWSGISRQQPRRADKQDDDTRKDDEEEQEEEEDDSALAMLMSRNCRFLHQTGRPGAPADPNARSFEMCGPGDQSHLVTTRPVAWALHDEAGDQVVRVNVGKGSVTVINSEPFRFKQILEGDNAALLVAATQLRRGDEVHFLSEEEHPSILTLMWLLGWPVVLLALALIALALWRNSVRFGPLVAVPDPARRSLAEQIRGTGRFVLRFGGGKALHAAAVRALNEAARRRVAAYSRLSSSERVDALARLTGIDATALGPAIHHDGPRRQHDLRQAIALIESARRRLQIETGAAARSAKKA
jgi:hypothetical protein